MLWFFFHSLTPLFCARNVIDCSFSKQLYFMHFYQVVLSAIASKLSETIAHHSSCFCIYCNSTACSWDYNFWSFSSFSSTTNLRISKIIKPPTQPLFLTSTSCLWCCFVFYSSLFFSLLQVSSSGWTIQPLGDLGCWVPGCGGDKVPVAWTWPCSSIPSKVGNTPYGS